MMYGSLKAHRKFSRFSTNNKATLCLKLLIVFTGSSEWFYYKVYFHDSASTTGPGAGP